MPIHSRVLDIPYSSDFHSEDKGTSYVPTKTHPRQMMCLWRKIAKKGKVTPTYLCIRIREDFKHKAFSLSALDEENSSKCKKIDKGRAIYTLLGIRRE